MRDEARDTGAPAQTTSSAAKQALIDDLYFAQEREIAQRVARTEPAGSRLALARLETIDAFVETLDELYDEGHDGYSMRAIAERYVGVDEKTVRRWCKRDSGKPIPLGALKVLPRAVARRLLAKMFPGGLP